MPRVVWRVSAAAVGGRAAVVEALESCRSMLCLNMLRSRTKLDFLLSVEYQAMVSWLNADVVGVKKMVLSEEEKSRLVRVTEEVVPVLVIDL